MLAISRKRDESLIIGDEIVITVIEIRGDKVRLGIDLPNHIPIHRKEVYDAIQRNNLHAPATPPAPALPQASARQTDQLDKLVAALRAKVVGSIDRNLVSQAMREAGFEQLGILK